MSKYILGKKVGMTQVFDESGLLIPVTVLQAGPCTVVDVKTKEKDGVTGEKVHHNPCFVSTNEISWVDDVF